MKKIIVNDYAGHPFQFDLSCELARRGHAVWHCYSFDVEGAKASFENSEPDTLTVIPISIGHQVRKYQFHKRWLDEIRYGKLVSAQIRKIQPDIVINANMPLDALKVIRKVENEVGARKVYWLQDMIGHAAHRLFRAKWYGIGALIGLRFLKLESNLIRNADHIVAISEGFEPHIKEHGGNLNNTTVIHNWAPIDDMPLRDRNNHWRKTYFPDDKFIFLYSGTLGLKHNPSALLDLARMLHQKSINAEVVVISEGLGADWLKDRKGEELLETLRIMPYQPFSELPEVLAAGDILVTLLEEDAGVFSVPSKILSYMCAGRPQLAAMPAGNLGASLIRENNCGEIVNPGDNSSFVQCALKMYAGPQNERDLTGTNARIFAEENFDINNITDRFENEIF